MGRRIEQRRHTFRRDYDLSLNRMTCIGEGPDRVRQILETSTDPKTWTKTYYGAIHPAQMRITTASIRAVTRAGDDSPRTPFSK